MLTKLQQWTDTVAALYFLLTGAIVWFHRTQFHDWGVYLSAHLLAATSLCMLRRLPLRRLTGVTGFFRDWHPALSFPVLFKEVEQFALAFGDWRLTNKMTVDVYGHLVPGANRQAVNGHPSLRSGENQAAVTGQGS